METLTETAFFQSVSGVAHSQNIKVLYLDFTYKVFELCRATDMDYGRVLFTLNHTEIELTSLREIEAGNGEGKKCGNATSYSKSKVVH